MEALIMSNVDPPLLIAVREALIGITAKEILAQGNPDGAMKGLHKILQDQQNRMPPEPWLKPLLNEPQIVVVRTKIASVRLVPFGIKITKILVPGRMLENLFCQ